MSCERLFRKAASRRYCRRDAYTWCFLQQVRGVEDVGHKLYMDNYFTSVYTFKTYTTEELFVSPLFGITDEECPQNFSPKPSKQRREVPLAEFYRSSRVRFPAVAGNFSLHHRVQDGSRTHTASYPVKLYLHSPIRLHSVLLS